MRVIDLYELKINRNINPAVVVSNNDKETVENEIGEYVFTDEILEKAYKFLNAIANKKEGKAGIWINGYYGSGKSHFLKFMHYCLDNSFTEQAFEKIIKASKNYDPYAVGHNEEISESNLKRLQNKIRELQCNDILFNVEAVTDDHSGEKLTRIFLNMFNKFRGYNSDDIPLALLLEKPLDKAGVYGKFKDLIKSRIKHDWDSEGSSLSKYKLDSILNIAKELLPDLDTVALHTTLTNPDTYHIGITSQLIPELKDYVVSRGEKFRLVFLVDEISQYIGNNKDILLNLQTIVEEVSGQLKNQVWIALTAQQSLEEVVERFGADAKNSDEFGKILGRFDTRISLESNDASFITRKRVLDKNATGTKVLNELFHDKKDFIQHQFKLAHDLYKGFQDTDDFILSYPFVPYQFRLIADVFSAFQKLGYVITEVKNNERSVIGVTHFTAKTHAQEEVGKFIAFDYFFNDLFKNNLTHHGNRVISKALELTYVKGNEFAQRVVRLLFMISNMEDNVLLTFPPNIENLSVLLMTDLDQNKLELQNKVRAVLEKLMEESIIREEKRSYFFYSEDEIQVTNLIKNQRVSSEDRFKLVDDLVRPILGISGKYTLEQSDLRIGYALDDKEFLIKGDIKVNVVLYDKQPINERALNTIANDLYICMDEWFNTDEQFRKDLENYCRHKVYFRDHSSAASGEREKTLQTFKGRNDTLESKIKQKFIENFSITRFISQQQIIEASAISGTTSQVRYSNLLKFHLERVFKFIKLANGFARTAADLRAKVLLPIQLDTADLHPAEAKVEEFIASNGNQVSIEDLVRNFSKIPFGWKDVAIIDMVVNLNGRKKRELEYRNTPRYPVKDFVEKAITTTERLACTVKQIGGIDPVMVNDAAKAFVSIFNKTITTATSEGFKVYDEMQSLLQSYHDVYNGYQDKYYHVYPFGNSFKEISDQLAKWLSIRDEARFFTELTDAVPAIKELRDKVEKNKAFVDSNLKKYDEIKSFYTVNQSNFKFLPTTDQQKAKEVGEFFLNPEPANLFRVVNKQYEDLKASFKSYLDTYRKEVVDQYKQLFVELEAEGKKQAVDMSGFINKEPILQRLQSLQSITDLQLEQSRLGDVRSMHLERIIEKAASQVGEPEPGKPKRTSQKVKVSNIKSVINNDEDLHEFVDALSDQLKKLLAENKSIIIE